MPQKQKVFDNDHYDLPLIYNVNGHTLHFGRHEFCLITGFKFGFNSFCKFRKGDISFHDRVFPKKIGKYVKIIDLLSVIEDEERFTGLSDEDSIRVCLLLSFEVIFMGHELGYAVDDVFLRMVDNLEAWNIWILECSSVIDHWCRKLSEQVHRVLGKKFHFSIGVLALEGLMHQFNDFTLKEIKSLKACVYKLETIINVITPKTKATHVKHKVNTAGTKQERRLRLQLMLEEENSIKSIDRSNFTHMKLALEKCRTTKRSFLVALGGVIASFLGAMDVVVGSSLLRLV
ncbi:phospholipase-like, aminotransferase-like mobile domain protein [Tanacetum coccineum]